MATLWQKKASDFNEASDMVKQFTAGNDADFDNLLAPFDIMGSIAHVKMLAKVGIISNDDLAALIPALERLLEKAKQGELIVQPGVEDIHSQVELLLTEELGEVGKKIHAARSRNDQVLVDLKLFLRHELNLITSEVKALGLTLLDLSDQHANTWLPGYTHYQVAMPSTFGLWLGAYAEGLAEDLFQVEAAYKLVNKNPLGSAAGYGSSFPIDREYTTQLLGFDDLHWNVVNAQMSRGKTEKSVANAMSAIAYTLGKLAQDITLYISQNFDFISFPESLTTGSSIMPHKKNPDVFELIRARCNRILALPNEIALITANLASGYHRDFQLLKEHLFPALLDLRQCLSMMTWALPQMEVKTELLNRPIYQYITSVEAVNELVNQGIAFRDAYKQVGLAIEAGQFEPVASFNHTHQGSLGNLCNNKIRAMFA